MEALVDSGRCRAIGLSDVSLLLLQPIYDAARIKRAVVQVEAHPYLPEAELLQFCKQNEIAPFPQQRNRSDLAHLRPASQH